MGQISGNDARRYLLMPVNPLAMLSAPGALIKACPSPRFGNTAGVKRISQLVTAVQDRLEKQSSASADAVAGEAIAPRKSSTSLVICHRTPLQPSGRCLNLTPGRLRVRDAEI